MARPSKLTEEDKQTIRYLHHEVGASYRDLSLRYEVHYNTILRICNADAYAKHLDRSRQYQKENNKTITAQNRSKQRRCYFTLSKKDDAAIIAYIDAQDNLNQYIKELIVNDMKAKGAAVSDSHQKK